MYEQTIQIGEDKKTKCYRRLNGTIFSIIAVFFISLIFTNTVYAAPPLSKFVPGETLNPSCGPTDTNCGVEQIFVSTSTQNYGIGTTSPYAKFSVVGEILGAFFTGTTTATSTFGGSLAVTSTGTSTFTNGISLSGGCFSVGGACLTSGGGSASGGTGAIQFANSTAFAGDAVNFFWDNTNKRLGIGIATPSSRLDITNSATSSAIISLRDPLGNVSLELRAGTSTLNNTFIGRNVGRINTTGQENTAIGHQALFSNTTGSSNIATGFQSLFSNTTGSSNTANGYSALSGNTTGFDNTASGFEALWANTTGYENAANGVFAMQRNTTGFRNTASGVYSLWGNTTGTNNTASGYESLLNNRPATSSTAVGAYAARGTGIYSNQGGVYLGFESGYSAGTGSDFNTLLGYRSGYGITTGRNNIWLGTATSSTGIANLTTGSQNILIGNNISLPSATADGQLNIGNIIFGTGITGTGSTLSSGNIGIGTTTPGYKLTINSTNATDNLFQIATTTNQSIFTVLANGNVGIGTTTPTSALGVNGSIDIATNGIIRNGGRDWLQQGTSGTTRFYANNSGGEFQFYFNTNNGGTNLINFNNLGNISAPTFTADSATGTSTFAGLVGIGSSLPSNIDNQYALFVRGNAADSRSVVNFLMDIGATPTTFNRSLQFTNEANTIGYGGFSLSSDTMRFGTNNLNLSFNINNRDLIFNGAAGGSELMRLVDKSVGRGNLGIGTSSPIARLDVVGALSGTSPLFQVSSLGASFATTTRLIVDSSGNVGIGTTSPGFRLQVQGASGDQARIGDITFGSTESGSNSILSGNTTVGSNGNLFVGTNVSTGILLFSTGSNVERVRITAAGLLGIGTTTPNSLLNIAANSGPQFLLTEPGAGVDLKHFYASTTAGDLTFGTLNDSLTTLTERFRITNAGNVGIGINSPFSRLEVHAGDALSGANNMIRVKNQSTSAGQAAGIGFSIEGNASSAGNITAKILGIRSGGNGIGDLAFYTNSSGASPGDSSTEKMRILSTGLVGIGTTTPATTLTVVGTTTIGSLSTAVQAGIRIGFGGLCADNDGSCTASTTGRISAVSYTTGATDLAENFVGTEPLQAGDIVMTNGGDTVGKANGTNSVIGIVSTKPGIILGLENDNENPNHYPIALSGRVPVKVNTENGLIKKGDRITLSSISGVGTKATATSTVTVGIALEDFKNTGTGATATSTILAFVNLNSQDANPKLEDLVRASAPETDNAGEKTFVGRFFDRIKSWFASAGNGIQKFFSKEVYTDKLCIGSTCVTEVQLQQLLNGQNASISNVLPTPTVEVVSTSPSQEISTSTVETQNNSTVVSTEPVLDPAVSIIEPALDTTAPNTATTP